jgi:hypothetical protein
MKAGKKMASIPFSYLGVLRQRRCGLTTAFGIGAAKLQLKHLNTALRGGRKYA